MIDYASLFSNVGSFAEVVTGVLGIAITVVAIIVELAATRYSPRISELFIRERLNLLILSFYIVTCIFGIWIAVLGHEPYTSWMKYLMLSYLILVTTSFVSILPYFIFVFTFLHPNNIINRLETLSRKHLNRAIKHPSRIYQIKPGFLLTIEQISDIGLNSIATLDRSLGLSCVDALGRILIYFLEKKQAFADEWFSIEEANFQGFSYHSVIKIEENHTWVEMAVLKQYEFIFGRAVRNNRELVQEITSDSRDIALAAVRMKLEESVELLVIYFNTFLRISFNERNQYAIYNIFDQYRSFAEEVMTINVDIPLQIANYFKYYGQSAIAVLPFTLVIASNDLRTLNQRAYTIKYAKRDELLEIFLELDKPPESAAEEIGFRGVRKSQALLAAFYLELGEEGLARKIYEDMAHEPLDRMMSIRDEILEVERERFWEVTDRWINFDYVTGPRREMLIKFFNWFETRGPLAKANS